MPTTKIIAKTDTPFISNVDNTADTAKPISTATQDALNLKVNTTDTIAIAKGGTGATTATAALNALLPSQTSNTGKVLQTNGTSASWETPSGGGGGTTTKAVTFNSSGSGAASGTTFNGSAAITISYNTLGALALAGGTMTGAINYAAPSNSSLNSILTLGGSRFLHTSMASAPSVGKNVFIGQNTPNVAGVTASNSYDAASNVAVGYGALASMTLGSGNLALGESAAGGTTTGSGVTAIGANAALGNATGNDIVAIGANAAVWKVDGSVMTNLSNVTCIGSNSKVSASNQIQLGSSGTTVYAFGAVQNRSDQRDKADIRDTVLGLEFINLLRPVDFRWDMRDDYIVTDKDEKGELVSTTLPKDGSKKRSRYHHGLIAQEVEQVITDTGIDFAGFQDHSKKGGVDVMSIGYTELIGPMIKAIQELTAKVSALEAQINGR